MLGNAPDMRFHHYLSLIVRIMIGGIFIVAGTLKLLDVNEFAWTIFQYGLVPQGLLPSVAIGLSIIEIAAGSAFVFYLPGSASAMLGLLGLFVMVLSYGIMTGLVMECGCFPGEELTGGSGLKAALIRDLVMASGVVYVYGCLRMQSKSISESAQIKR